MQQHVRRARRARPEERADDAGRGQRRAQRLGLEPLADEVGRRHGQHLDESGLLRFGQSGETTGQAGQVDQAHRVECVGARRGLAQQRLGEARHLRHQQRVLLVCLGVLLGPAAQFAHGPAVVVGAPQVVVVERRQRAVDRQHLKAVPRQLQFANDLRPQQADDIRSDTELEAGKDLFGDGRAAQDLAAFQDDDAAACSRQIGRRRQPVVAATDDDGVVGLPHAAKTSRGRQQPSVRAGAGGTRQSVSLWPRPAPPVSLRRSPDRRRGRRRDPCRLPSRHGRRRRGCAR